MFTVNNDEGKDLVSIDNDTFDIVSNKFNDNLKVLNNSKCNVSVEAIYNDGINNSKSCDGFKNSKFNSKCNHNTRVYKNNSGCINQMSRLIDKSDLEGKHCQIDYNNKVIDAELRDKVLVKGCVIKGPSQLNGNDVCVCFDTMGFKCESLSSDRSSKAKNYNGAECILIASEQCLDLNCKHSTNLKKCFKK
jgi:hypothetical protein